MQNSLNILVVDDDESILRMLFRYLEKQGMNVKSALNEAEATGLLSTHPVDIVLLDLYLPDIQGFDLLEKIRKAYKDIGIIVMTGNEEPIDRVVGLELGADDYINKPFELRELLARIRSVYRRTGKNDEQQDAPAITVQEAKNLSFNGWRYEVRPRFLYSPDNQQVKLTTHEARLLEVFIRSENRVLERNFLLKEVFIRDWNPDDRSVDMLVSKLRKKLGNRETIVNDRSKGYRFTPLVESI